MDYEAENQRRREERDRNLADTRLKRNQAEGNLQHLVPRLEALIGPRWGGLWLEQRQDSLDLNVGVVAPTTEDVFGVQALCRDDGWSSRVHGVRHAWAELEEIVERIRGLQQATGEVINGVGASSEWNKVSVRFTRYDRQVLDRVFALAPPDAIVIHGEGWRTVLSGA